MPLTNPLQEGFCLQGIAVGFAMVFLLGASTATAQVFDPVSATRDVLQEAKAQAANQPRASLHDRETYLRHAEIVDVRLAADGLHLSFLRHGQAGFDVMLQNVTTGVETRIAAGLQRVDTAWSGDGSRLWFADEQGLAVVECADLSTKRIYKWDARRSQRLWTIDQRATQYAVIREKIVESGVEHYRYLSVDAQGKTRLLLEAEWPLRSILLNATGDLAFTAAFDGPGYETVIRQYTAGQPSELLRCGNREEGRLVGYNEAKRTLWLLSRHDEDKLSLLCWSGESGRWETIHRDPVGVVDVDALLWSAAREDWLAIAYHDARRCWYGNDDETSSQLIALKQLLPEANLQLSVTTDGQLWLVQAQQGDIAQDRYYLYHPDENRLQPLFASEDAAKNNSPSGVTMHPVSYRASDGMLLHGYVLLPGGIAPDTAPLIAWLHGGPISRMYDEYNGGIQLLVNRGYALFIPNFRASTGYGLDYVLAANGDVGNGRVLADIIEGMDFLLAEGIGDRDRQAAMGMSFGGYASLLAISHHPARFRFAFAGAPPTDYGWIKQWQAEHDNEALRPEGLPLKLRFPLLGFPFEDPAWREKMQRESPLAALPALQAPVYIWAGARDDRVPLKSIVHYVGDARRLDKPLCLLIDPDAGHSPESNLGIEASLYLIELAAHRHFGGELSAISTELQAFLDRNIRIDQVVPRKP
ncbi:MAG: prolyl oligopeptidase family serine peptidase [Pirellulaceae bacterium]